jgi:hypothetical protein
MHANPSVLCSDGKRWQAPLRFCISTHALPRHAKPSSFRTLPPGPSKSQWPPTAHLFVHETKRNETNICTSLQAAKTHLGNRHLASRISPWLITSCPLNQTWRPACTLRNWRRRFAPRRYRAGLVGIACSSCPRGHPNRRRLRGLCSRPCHLNLCLRHH